MQLITCFWLEPIARVQVTLRRFAHGVEQCLGHFGYHNVELPIGFKDVPVPPVGTYERVAEQVDRADERWPKQCSCGHLFAPDDPWQVNEHRLYARSDGGEPVTIDDAPPGAMWNAWWYGDTYKGPDGQSIVLKTPGGEWVIDGPASSGGHWTRHGTPPKLTVTPSILMHVIKRGDGRIVAPGYHGVLTDGVLRQV